MSCGFRGLAHRVSTVIAPLMRVYTILYGQTLDAEAKLRIPKETILAEEGCLTCRKLSLTRRMSEDAVLEE